MATATPFSIFTRTADSDYVRIGVRIEKIDKAKRIVRGRATAEVLDAHGQVVDYETAKAAFAAWKGNIREMHQPKAVGKAVEVEFDDVAKEIYLSAYVSKGAPDTWEKVLDGTLAEYSIGVRAIMKTEKFDGSIVEKLYIQKLNETSLVDAGACPGCSFEVVKMDGEQPVAAQELTDEDMLDDSDAVDTPAPSDDPAPSTGTPAPAADDTPAPEPATKAEVLGLLQVARPDRIKAFDALAARGYETPVQKRVEGWDIRNALAAIGYVEELVASEIWEATDAARGNGVTDAEGSAQLEMLKGSAELLLGYLISEFMAQFDDVPATDGMLKSVVDVRRRVVGVPDLQKAIAHVGLTARDRTPAPTEPPSDHVPAAAVTKLDDQLSETTKALTQAQDTIRAQAESLSALQTRIEKLEAQPMPGGPVTRSTGTPVTKALGNSPDDVINGADPAEVIKVLTDLANQAPSPQAREHIAQKLISYQMQHGVGRQVITRPSE